MTYRRKSMFDTNVVVIGAGPVGLSTAAHLSHAGVERRVFGRTMDAWRSNMPAGMFLKSEPYGSDLSAPEPGHLLGDYCRTAGEEYHARVLPVSIERFISYGSWFAEQLVPDVEDVQVVSVAQAPSGFLLRTADGDEIRAARVVVATGIIPFAQVPAQLEGLPRELVSHTSAHTDLGRFAGKEVLVLGAGQSALETAALLHEHGALVKLVMRQDWGIFWLDANPMTPTRLERLRRPVVRLCEGWFCWRYDRLGDLYRFLPADSRVNRAFNTLGPAGAWWLRERVEGRVPVLLGHSLVGAEASGDRVRLHLKGPNGAVTEEADHVIAGTGYRLNIDRLSFLEPALRGRLKLAGGAPILDHGFESSVPGLFFTGVLAAPSFGPAMRFVSGTHFSAPRVARRLRSVSRRSPVAISRPVGERVPELSETP
jgi:NADPH-dependent 2,4-dienoyl-CoA reductase/sulfur reductase-like enzyme